MCSSTGFNCIQVPYAVLFATDSWWRVGVGLFLFVVLYLVFASFYDYFCSKKEKK